MMAKAPRSLRDMALDALKIEQDNGIGISCPKCGCRDFRVYRTSQGVAVSIRYKSCRHCGHKVLTSSQVSERIVRDVSVQVDED